MTKDTFPFLQQFPGHVYRYIDQTGAGRPPLSTEEARKDLNDKGYDAYFTVNGFKGEPNAKKERCTSLNAFFVDIDGRKDADELEKIKEKLSPTFIIETKRGHHIYWLLDEVIYKNEVTDDEWNAAVAQWEAIELSIVTALKGDPVVKDLTRILRVPGSLYWKGSGDAWKEGKDKAPFKIKGIYKNATARYSMREMAEAFPVIEMPEAGNTLPVNDKMRQYAEAEKRDFFDRVNKAYPIEERPSFQALISGQEGTLPGNLASRNEALLVVASLMRQAGWSETQAKTHVKKVGWHGIEKEHGGKAEIEKTIASAYRGGYVYSHKHPVIAHNVDATEERMLSATYTAVMKQRKEVDKTRFSIYEFEIRAKHPHLKRNDAGIVFNYENGVYRMLSSQELSNLIQESIYEDMLWGYRTKKAIGDKVACLLSIIPDLELTNDRGRIVNVKNGLLDIISMTLTPHTPEYVSLTQCPVIFDPKAEASTWTACMHAWMEGEEEEAKVKILQQFAGYCLTSSMKHAKALFLVGDGGNGKSTFADTIAMVLGREAVSRIDLEDIYSMFGLAGLIGKRLNIIEEVSGNYYQSHKLKKLVSGEEVTVNMKYKEQFKFLPQAKFIFAVNTMPRVDDSSVASERRICAVEFKNNFRDRPDTELRFADGKLAQELSGILNWMLAGARSLNEEKGFAITQEQRDLLSEYRQENSAVEGFIADCLVEVEGGTLSTTELYESYKQYCLKDGRKPKSRISMIKEMKAYSARHGRFSYHERVTGHETNRFEGLGISEDWKTDHSIAIF